MTPDQAQLARTSLARRFSVIPKDGMTPPPYGWVRAVREALGMTPKKLGERMGVTRPRVNKLEKAEVTGSTTIKTLREAAEAMNCVFVYAIVPRTSLDETVRAQAEERADAELARIHHTMCLENQAVDKSAMQDAKELLVQKYLRGSSFRLWDTA